MPNPTITLNTQLPGMVLTMEAPAPKHNRKGGKTYLESETEAYTPQRTNVLDLFFFSSAARDTGNITLSLLYRGIPLWTGAVDQDTAARIHAAFQDAQDQLDITSLMEHPDA